MPLYVIKGDDHRQITTDDLARILKIDKNVLKSIEKNPVFEINPRKTQPDRLNGGVIAPAGKASKPYFYVKVDKNETITTDISGIRITIRYAESIVPDRENPRISTYEPKRVWFYDQLDMVADFELALFKYCLPACENSPVADKRNWHYRFQNKEGQAEEVNMRGRSIAKALAYLNNPVGNGGLSDTQIILVAKGLYTQNRNPAIIPNPSAHNKTLAEIRADLTQLALKDPDLFLNSCNDDVNEFYGMVMDAVDRGIFGIRRGTHKKAWYWEQGPNTNTHITDISTGINDFDALKGAIEANPNAYYAMITKAVTEAAGKDNISSFLKGLKDNRVQQEEEPVIPNPDDEGVVYTPPPPPPAKEEPEAFIMPTNYADSIKLANTLNGGKNPPAKVLGKFWHAIKPGASPVVDVEQLKPTLEKIIAEEI